jgi:sterol desaturase/sphingolipid hydroxylase (fatty acid hydroxylase superfamily)
MSWVDLNAVRQTVIMSAMMAAILLTIRVVEKTFPIEPNQPRREIWLDYQLAAVCMLLPGLLSPLTSLTSGTLIAGCGGGLIRLRGDGWWFAPSLAIYVVASDFYRYWIHRLSHSVPMLWRLHSFHHSAEAVTFITGARHHWLDRVLNVGFIPLFQIVFKTSPEVSLAGAAIYFLPDTCAHLNVRFSLGRYVMWITSPQYHRIHHSLQPEHFDKNFAGILPLWDILFGTAWRPGVDEFPPTGLDDGDKPRHVWDGVIWPVRGLLSRKAKAVADRSIPRPGAEAFTSPNATP